MQDPPAHEVHPDSPTGEPMLELPATPSASPGEAVRLGKPPSDPPGWPARLMHGTRRMFLRFAFVYLLLFAFPFPLQLIPDVRSLPQIWHDSKTPVKEVNWDLPQWVDDAYTWRGELSMDWVKWERSAVDRVTRDVFGIIEPLERPRGSGDPTYGYIEVATRAGAALGVALIWLVAAALVARFTRRSDRFVDWLAPWMHVAGRYYLASVLLGYGLAKVYPSQFRFPDFARLETPYGDGSPMNILWNFMGSSKAYIIFSGVMEVLPALLLFTRRTALLGALLGAAVMANVVLLNYCYDVPVKLLSSHLFLLAVALASVDLKRLASVFLLNRPVPPRDLSRPRTGWFGHAVRLLILVPYLALSVDRIVESYRHPPEPHELRGIWDVEQFLVDGEERVPRTDDALRFQALIVDGRTRIKLKTMDGSLRSVDLSRSRKGTRLTLGTRSNWQYRLEGDELVLQGEFERVHQPDSAGAYAAGIPRDPQLEVRLRRDPDHPTEEVNPRRERVPEELRGRWVSTSSEIIGKTATRRRATPYGFDALIVHADGKALVQYELSEQEFKFRATPDELPNPSGEVARPEPAEAREDAEEPEPILSKTHGSLTLRSTSKFDMVQGEDGTMQLEGKLRGVDVEVALRLRDPESFLLVRRGFHWINEIPLNRY